MPRVTTLVVLGCALLCACKTVRVYPLAGPQGDLQALFEPLIACADADQLGHRLAADSLHVQLRPGVSAQFIPRPASFTVVVSVDDGTGGGDREGSFAAAKRRSELLFACARGPEPAPSSAP